MQSLKYTVYAEPYLQWTHIINYHFCTCLSSMWRFSDKEILISDRLLPDELKGKERGEMIPSPTPISLQDSKRLPDVSWPPPDLAAEHGREAQQQEVLHGVCNVSGARCRPGGWVPQHAGGSQVPACWQCHLSGRPHKHIHTEITRR